MKRKELKVYLTKYDIELICRGLEELGRVKPKTEGLQRLQSSFFQMDYTFYKNAE